MTQTFLPKCSSSHAKLWWLCTEYVARAPKCAVPDRPRNPGRRTRTPRPAASPRGTPVPTVCRCEAASAGRPYSPRGMARQKASSRPGSKSPSPSCGRIPGSRSGLPPKAVPSPVPPEGRRSDCPRPRCPAAPGPVFFQRRHAWMDVPPRTVEKGMVNRRRILAPKAEADRVEDGVHDLGQVFADIFDGQIGAHRLVAAGDVETDPRRRDEPVVSDHPPMGIE